MDKKISEILDELYVIDPKLKEIEKQLVIAISKMLSVKPDIIINVAFRDKLKNKLMKNGTNKQEWQPTPLNGRMWKLMGAVGVMAILLLIATTSFNSALPKVDKTKGDLSKLVKFSSDEEAIEYLTYSDNNYFDGFGDGGGGFDFAVAESRAIAGVVTLASDDVPRYSDTNVQILGIDEADIVKTNGEEIFYGRPPTYDYISIPRLPVPPLEEPVDEFVPSEPIRNYRKGSIEIIDARNPHELKKISNLPVYGQMYLSDNTLIVEGVGLDDHSVIGFDVSNPSKPKEIWRFKLDAHSSLASSRVFEDGLYLVIRRWSGGTPQPCPVVMASIAEADVTVPCTEIYHSDLLLPTSSILTLTKLDIDDGSVEATNSLAVPSGLNVVSMSKSAIYVSYSGNTSSIEVTLDFIRNEASSLFPTEVMDKINNLQKLDIGDNAKSTEIREILVAHYGLIGNEAYGKLRKKLEDASGVFSARTARQYRRSAIVRFSLRDLEIEATGEIPGAPLNQFSIDEYEGNVRISTTVQPIDLRDLGTYIQSGQSENDVYVLDGDLNVIGSATGLGIDERIYATRFIKNKGYVVTFKETDPFYVIDLTNPKDIKVVGELKIPGFSSYLHPLTDTLMLGVGREGSGTKLSLFDIGDPSNPKEIDKYLTVNNWSEVQSTHHAFLHDPDKEAFFLPMGNFGAGIFTYKDNKLTYEINVLPPGNVRRAVFIGDYMYIAGDEGIVVVDENFWRIVSIFTF